MEMWLVRSMIDVTVLVTHGKNFLYSIVCFAMQMFLILCSSKVIYFNLNSILNKLDLREQLTMGSLDTRFTTVKKVVVQNNYNKKLTDHKAQV
jgi:hypothetical protein